MPLPLRLEFAGNRIVQPEQPVLLPRDEQAAVALEGHRPDRLVPPAQGGDLKVESTLGSGTTATIRFPRRLILPSGQPQEALKPVA